MNSPSGSVRRRRSSSTTAAPVGRCSSGRNGPASAYNTARPALGARIPVTKTENPRRFGRLTRPDFEKSSFPLHIESERETVQNPGDNYPPLGRGAVKNAVQNRRREPASECCHSSTLPGSCNRPPPSTCVPVDRCLQPGQFRRETIEGLRNMQPLVPTGVSRERLLANAVLKSISVRLPGSWPARAYGNGLMPTHSIPYHPGIYRHGEGPTPPPCPYDRHTGLYSLPDTQLNNSSPPLHLVQLMKH
jgi:hypothetical protein